MSDPNFNSPNFSYDDPFGEDIVDSPRLIPKPDRGDPVNSLPLDVFNDDSLLGFLSTLTDAPQAPAELPELNPNVVVANHQNIHLYLSDENVSLNKLHGLKNSEHENQLNETRPVVPPPADFGKAHHKITLSHKIAIVRKLEKYFRLRYKSDYFSQYGRKRKPRYVADELKNHFIALEISNGLRGYIRVDWVTVADELGRRYWMPYKFQEDNINLNVPDVNPIHVKIEGVTNGIMKLYLVLIKAKQDQLIQLQPLVPFEPYRSIIDPSSRTNVQGYTPLNPKELIRKYQLEKSQLAFTYCSIAADGVTPIPEWDTTVFSSILTEIQARGSKRKPAECIDCACPRCGHHFQTQPQQESEDDDSEDETNTDSATMSSLKRKSS